MSTFHAQQVRKHQAEQYATMKDLCERNDIRLSKDPVDGYWLHFDGKMKFISSISNIPEWIDWIQSGN